MPRIKINEFHRFQLDNVLALNEIFLFYFFSAFHEFINQSDKVLNDLLEKF